MFKKHIEHGSFFKQDNCLVSSHCLLDSCQTGCVVHKKSNLVHKNRNLSHYYCLKNSIMIFFL